MNEIKKFTPFNEQEEKDKAEILNYLSKEHDVLTRNNKNAHLTVSAWLIDNKHENLLMAYHNIYHSWAWLDSYERNRPLLNRILVCRAYLQ